MGCLRKLKTVDVVVVVVLPFGPRPEVSAAIIVQRREKFAYTTAAAAAPRRAEEKNMCMFSTL